MCSASELVDGYEPHAMFYLRDTARCIDQCGEWCTRGGVARVRLGGYWEGAIPGTTLRPHLTLI